MSYKKIDKQKVEIGVLLYVDNWDTMATFDQDPEAVAWHVGNCMTYITQLSEGIKPLYLPPPDMVLGDDWSELELLSLYRDVVISAVKRGYEPDPGMITRIKQNLKQPRVKMRRYVRP